MTAFQLLKHFLILTNVDCLIFYNEMCQQLEDLHNLVDQYFSTKQFMGKRSTQSTKNTIYFNVTKYKMFIDKVFNSSLKLTFRKLQSVEF